MGLLSNSTLNLIIVFVGLFIALILLIIFEGLKRNVKYNRVEDESEHSEEDQKPS